MRTGEPVTAAPGRTSDKVLDLDASIVMGAINANVEPHPNYRARNYALFVNGVWRRNETCGSDDRTVGICYPIDNASNSTSISVVEVGNHESFDETEYVPGGWILEEEAGDAARIRVQWTAGYRVDEGYGDSSLASVTLNGVTRGGNCQPDDSYPVTRCRVWYTIEDVGGTRIVRLWSGDRLVASGSRVGDGLVTLDQNNGSGLTGQAILTYTADVVPGQAYVLVRWPMAYNLHYSTSPLTYPRTPEMVVYDVGVTRYVALTPILPAGSYNYSVQGVGDDQIEQSPVNTPSDSPKNIKSPPLPGTIIGASGNAATGITVTWSRGEPGCSWTMYYSLVDEPVNFGQWPEPSPIIRPVGASSVVLAPISGYSPLDRTAAWNAFLSGIDGIMASVNAAFEVGWTVFPSTVATSRTQAISAIQALSDATGIPTPEFYERIGVQFDSLADQGDGAPTITLAAWQSYVGPAMSKFMDDMSGIVVGQAGRYSYVDGTLPYSQTPTTDSAYGEVSITPTRDSVLDLVSPLVTNRVVRCVLRATRVADGLQEVCDDVYRIELDENGDVVPSRPNQAWITSVSGSGLTTTFEIQYAIDNQSVAPTAFDVYVVSAPGSINYGNPSGTVSAGSPTTGLILATVSVTVGAPGYYVVATKARSASGTRSENATERVVWIGSESPAGPTSVTANVIRSTPSSPVEDS